MKVYEVCWEEDGKTIKEPGVTHTELIKHSAYFVADSPEAAWDACAYIRTDPERNFKFMATVLESVNLVPPTPTVSDA